MGHKSRFRNVCGTSAPILTVTADILNRQLRGQLLTPAASHLINRERQAESLRPIALAVFKSLT
jgi:hypothetical protein